MGQFATLCWKKMVKEVKKNIGKAKLAERFVFPG